VVKMITKNEKSRITKERKGDISIQILIWIALGLIVLIVVIALITGKVKFFTENSPDRCIDASNCVATDEQCKEGALKIKTSDCPTAKPFCCKQIV
jgi:hypothetical protein